MAAVKHYDIAFRRMPASTLAFLVTTEDNGQNCIIANENRSEQIDFFLQKYVIIKQTNICGENCTQIVFLLLNKILNKIKTVKINYSCYIFFDKFLCLVCIFECW